MTYKKIFFGIIVLGSLGGCAAPTTMLGPAYTFTSTGSIAQAGLTYGSNELVINYTGKTPIENLEEIASKNIPSNNIQKKTLESDDFYILVKQKIDTTGSKIKLSNQ
tara:strand:+ start:115 stop:435 length:321 start_codon:yes stop_codon:yes gene_type:complete